MDWLFIIENCSKFVFTLFIIARDIWKDYGKFLQDMSISLCGLTVFF